MGYKKTSAQDIAQAAGISKGMVFHYFGSKKGLYQYLIKVASDEITQAFAADLDSSVSDFFDRILMLTSCKLRCLQKHPSLLSFFTSLYAETAPEVYEDVQAAMQLSRQIHIKTILIQDNREKFKDPAYADLAWKLLTGYGESCINSAKVIEMSSLVDIMHEFERCVCMLKQNLYKEDYLSPSLEEALP